MGLCALVWSVLALDDNSTRAREPFRANDRLTPCCSWASVQLARSPSQTLGLEHLSNSWHAQPQSRASAGAAGGDSVPPDAGAGTRFQHRACLHICSPLANLAKGARRAADHAEAVAYEVAFDAVRLADQDTRRDQAANWKVSGHTSGSLSTSAGKRVSRNLAGNIRQTELHRGCTLHTCTAWVCLSDDAVPEARASTVARAQYAAVFREQCHHLAKQDAGTHATHAAAGRAEAAQEAALPRWPTCARFKNALREGVLGATLFAGSSRPGISPRCVVSTQEH